MLAIVGLIIVMTLVGETIDDVQAAGNTVNATGAPLSGLFAGDGVAVLLFVAGALIAVIGLAFAGWKAYSK